VAYGFNKNITHFNVDLFLGSKRKWNAVLMYATPDGVIYSNLNGVMRQHMLVAVTIEWHSHMMTCTILEIER